MLDDKREESEGVKKQMTNSLELLIEITLCKPEKAAVRSR
jgi:hypothetical protein